MLEFFLELPGELIVQGAMELSFRSLADVSGPSGRRCLGDRLHPVGCDRRRRQPPGPAEVFHHEGRPEDVNLAVTPVGDGPRHDGAREAQARKGQELMRLDRFGYLSPSR
jgi:hypothetical protein